MTGVQTCALPISELQGLLLESPDDVGALVRRLEDWRTHGADWAPAVAAVSSKLRAWTWDAMAEALVARLEA